MIYIYLAIAGILIIVLFRLGWRPLINATFYYDSFRIRNGIALCIAEKIIVGLDISNPDREGCGGSIVFVVFDGCIGLWRDPYRSKNSTSYMMDKQ